MSKDNNNCKMLRILIVCTSVSAAIALTAVICFVFCSADEINALIATVCGLGVVTVASVVCFTVLCVVCVRSQAAVVKTENNSPEALRQLLIDYYGELK